MQRTPRSRLGWILFTAGAGSLIRSIVRHRGDMFQSIQSWFRRRRFREGRTLSQFVARDVRRDIQIVSAARIDEGFITARVRTLNVLYVSKDLTAKPEFEPEREMRLDEIWKWTGKSWGGLPDGTSIVEHLR
jgi:hypothetical protein